MERRNLKEYLLTCTETVEQSHANPLPTPRRLTAAYIAPRAALAAFSMRTADFNSVSIR